MLDSGSKIVTIHLFRYLSTGVLNANNLQRITSNCLLCNMTYLMQRQIMKPFLIGLSLFSLPIACQLLSNAGI